MQHPIAQACLQYCSPPEVCDPYLLAYLFSMRSEYFSFASRLLLSLLTSCLLPRQGAPISPDVFERDLGKCTFTNGSDAAAVIELYRRTSEGLLGSVRSLSFKRLKWTAAEFTRLGSALPLCRVLQDIVIEGMALDDPSAQAVVPAMPPSLHRLSLSFNDPLTSLPPLPDLPLLHTLDIRVCHVLTVVDALPTLPSLVFLTIAECPALPSLPDLPPLPALREINVSGCRALKQLPPLTSTVAFPSLQRLVLVGCRNLSLGAHTHASFVANGVHVDLPEHLRTLNEAEDPNSLAAPPATDSIAAPSYMPAPKRATRHEVEPEAALEPPSILTQPIEDGTYACAPMHVHLCMCTP